MLVLAGVGPGVEGRPGVCLMTVVGSGVFVQRGGGGAPGNPGVGSAGR